MQTSLTGVKKKIPTWVKQASCYQNVEMSYPESVVVTSLPEGGWRMFTYDNSIPSTPVSGVKVPLPIVWQGFINIMSKTQIFLHAVKVTKKKKKKMAYMDT